MTSRKQQGSHLDLAKEEVLFPLIEISKQLSLNKESKLGLFK